VPEPKVFLGPARGRDDYIAEYDRLFADAGSATALGEKTSYYLENEEACERIAANLAETRLLFIVREPVARAYSNYLWSRKNGIETGSFEDAIATEGRRASPLPPEKAYARPFDYQARGDYATFARRYFRALGRDRVAFFLYEDLELRPGTLLEGVQRFVGVDPRPTEELDVGRVNAARDEGPPIDPGTERRLREQMAPLVREFAAASGLDVGPWGYG
jgi:hypothetical protein